METTSGGGGWGGKPPPVEKEQIKENSDQDHNAKDKEQGNEATKGSTSEKRADTSIATSSKCKPIAPERPKIDLPSHRINARIKCMKDHALIEKFISLWPNWKSTAGMDCVQMEAKGTHNTPARPERLLHSHFQLYWGLKHSYGWRALFFQLSWAISQKLGRKIQPR